MAIPRSYLGGRWAIEKYREEHAKRRSSKSMGERDEGGAHSLSHGPLSQMIEEYH